MANTQRTNKIAMILYIFNWIFGLGIIQYPLGHQHPTISFIYSSIWIISYITFSAIAYPHVMKWSLTMVNSLVPLKIFFCSNITLTLSAIILAYYRTEAILCCVKKSQMLYDLMERIGININAQNIRKAYMRKLITSTILILNVIAVNAILIKMEDFPLYAKIAAMISFCYPVVILFIADMTFVISLSVVGHKYQILNKTLRNILVDEPDVSRHERLVSQLINADTKPNLDTISFTVNDPTNVIKTAKEIHMQLLKLCEETNISYGLQILLSIVVAFGVITGNVYVTYVVLMNRHIKRDLAFKSIINSAVWAFYYAFKISNFTDVCCRCKQNTIETGDILNQFYDDPSANEEVQSEIRDFNVQLIQRPLNFTAAGYIALDTRLMTIMITTIITYLMILIELGKNTT